METREINPPDPIECEQCEGTGMSGTSECCGAEFDTDTMLCYECHDHCGEGECGECEGTGTVAFKN